MHNFLGTYTSRYSDYDGYWVFGMLVDRLTVLEIDLRHSEDSGVDETPVGAAKRYAVERFAEQMAKAGLPLSLVRDAQLNITKLPGAKRGPVNGRPSDGYDIRFTARVVSDVGKTYEWTRTVFVAPHNPRIELRSIRATPKSVEVHVNNKNGNGTVRVMQNGG